VWREDGDGAAALRRVNEVGGITIAQRLDTAGLPDMPQSAIAGGWIDFVPSHEDVARKSRPDCAPLATDRVKVFHQVGNTNETPVGT